MCNEDDRCVAWSYEKNNCSLKDSMPLHAYRPDVISGKPGNTLNKGGHSLVAVPVILAIFLGLTLAQKEAAQTVLGPDNAISRENRHLVDKC